jgi:hypothetical protein
LIGRMRLVPIVLVALVSSTVLAKPASLSRDQIDEDVAVLEQTLTDAWAWSSRQTVDSFKALPHYMRDGAKHASDAPALCAGLGEALRNTGVIVELGGVRCGRASGAATAPGTLDTVPANRNYLVRFDAAKDHEIAIVTIAHFVDPADPGWKGFADAMRKVAKHDFVIVDLQHADGDDPRAGFAILAALGREDYDRAYLQRAMFRDGPAAKAARAAFATLPGTAPAARDRKLWSTFTTGNDVKRIAREVVPGIARATPALKSPVLVGPDCGRACQLVVGLVRWSGVDIAGSFDNTVSGDELGALQLPHSGIVATFPTAAYGTYIIGELERQQLPAGYSATLLAGLHDIAHRRADSTAWQTRRLPVCAKLPVDPKALGKASGCFSATPPAANAVESVELKLSIDAMTATKFLSSCNLQGVHSGMDMGVDGSSWVTIIGTRTEILRVLAAPFVSSASWPCESHDEPN